MTSSFSDNKQPGRAVSPVSTGSMRQHFYVMTSLYSTSPVHRPPAPAAAQPAPAWVTRYTNWDMFITRELRTAAGTRCSGGWPGVAPGGNVGI